MFRTQQEQNKWNAIQDEGSGAIDRMMRGEATQDDIAALTRIIARQHALAGQIFEEQINGVEATADTIIDKLNKDRIEVGKRPLTQRAQDRLFRQTYQRVLQSSVEDILGSVQDRLEEDQPRTRAIDRVLRPRPPTPEPSDVGPLEPEDATETERTISRRLARIEKILKNATANARDRVGQGLNRVRTRSRDLLDSGRERANSAGRSLRDMIRNPRDSARSAVTYMTNASHEIKDAVINGWKKLTNPRRTDDDEGRRSMLWLRQLKAMFGAVGDKFGAVKRWGSKVKAGAGKVMDFLGPLAKVLLVALTNPALISSIADQIEKYLNFDTISNFIASSWTEIKNSGADVVNWVIKQVKDLLNPKASTKNTNVGTDSFALPKNLTSAEATKAIPGITAKLDRAKKELADAESAYKADPSKKNKDFVDYDQTKVVNLQKTLNAYVQASHGKPLPTEGQNQTDVVGQAVSKPDQLATPQSPRGTDQNPVQTSADNPTGPASQNLMTTQVVMSDIGKRISTQNVVPQDVFKASSVVLPDMPKYTEGVSVSPQSQASESQDQQASRNMIHSGSISLGSFGFNSADDTLNIMNLGLIS